jgi:hypothetical protein
MIQGIGAFGMSMGHSKILKKYDIEKTKEREALWKVVGEWENEVGGRKFRGGEEVDLSDLSVYG